jgi:hypothetical protein
MDGSLGNPQSLNRYAYTVNNRTSFINPLGLYCVGKDGKGIPGGDENGCDPSIGIWIMVDGEPVTNFSLTLGVLLGFVRLPE